MRNKPKDELYCGVRQKKIQRANPELDIDALNLFTGYIKERYKVHIKKDVQYKKPPWTTNKILQKYRFTNIKREHDRETIWLIRNIAENDFLTYRQKLLNTILFRLYNKHETMEIIGAPFKFEGVWTFVPALNKAKIYAKNHPDYVFFTNAFITGGMKRALKGLFPQEKFVPGVVLRYMKSINENGLIDDIKNCKNQQEVFNVLKNTFGIGDFLAYQIFVDFTYIKDFPFSENEFTVAGPGCKKGIDFLFKDKDKMSYEECLFWLRDNWDDVNLRVNKENQFDPWKEMVDLKRYDRIMNVMSLENCFCEFSKYYKVVKNLGRPRNNYKRSENND